MFIQRETHNVKLSIWTDDYTNVMKFQDTDLKLLESEAGVNNIMSAFDKSTYRFNLVVMTPKEAQALSGNAYQLASDFCLFEYDESAINCLYTNNITSRINFIPFTGWIAAHRLGHAIQFFSRELGNNWLNPMVRATLQTLAEKTAVRFTAPSTTGGDNVNDLAEHEQWFARHILTMRSARQDRLLNSAETFAELVAQYIVTGSVKLARWPDWYGRVEMFKKHPEYKRVIEHTVTHPYTHKTPQPGSEVRMVMEKALDFNMFDELDVIIGDLEQKINEQIKRILDDAVGKKLHF